MTVAPPAGAWIETYGKLCEYISAGEVAPPAGAWIETKCCFEQPDLILVAPPAGAWIETAHTR